MKVDIYSAMWLLAVCVVTAAMAASSSSNGEETDKEVRKQELYLLAKLLHQPERLHKDLDKQKRQGAWDMDYGWGGGRFGKRADMLDYGWGGGRFGKRADMLDYGWGGGRFGKRSGDMLDYGWGGGRFGKRSSNNNNNNRANTNQKPAGYEAYLFDGRFGRDVDHVDPADEPQ